MTRLLITLHQPHARGLIKAGAVASVSLLEDLDGDRVERWWSEEKPVAIIGEDRNLDRPTIFDLPGGGNYGIEITGPRGPAISLEYRIEEGEERPETIVLESSPHEHLGWHQYAGIVRRTPLKRDRARGGPPTGSGRMEQMIAQSQEQTYSLYDNVRDVPQVFAAELPPLKHAWQMVTEATRQGGCDWATANLRSDLSLDSDEEYATWCLGAPEPQEGIDLIAGLKLVPQPNDAGSKYPRWMSFKTDGKIDLASVPWPWWGARNEEGGEIRVVYDRVRANSVDRNRPGRLTVSVIDQRWFGMLEFLASGRLSYAKEMFKEIMEKEHPDDLFHPDLALYGKVKGPLVATAGAIVLVAGAESAEEQRWDPWIRNLSQWFPGVPDGPILLGCRRITQAASLSDFQNAFNDLQEGIDRGIPFFSGTIQMLSTSLAQIGGDLPEADELRRFIAPVSTRVDPEQVFTVIRL